MQFNPLQLPRAADVISMYEAGQENRVRQMKLKREQDTQRTLADVFSGAGNAPYGMERSGGMSAVMDSYGSNPSASTGQPAVNPVTAPASGGMATIAGGPEAPAMRPRPTSQRGLQINPEALDRLGRLNPEMALKIREMDTRQRNAMLEEMDKQLTIGGRVAASVLQAPPERQNEVYQLHRQRLEESGIVDLPDDWDPQLARSRMEFGMTVAEALGAQQRQERLSWDIEDDIADNETLDDYREGQLVLGRERIEQSDRSSRRSAATSRINTVRRNASQEARELRRQAYELRHPKGKAGRSSGASRSATIVNPQTGQRMKLEGGKWVPVN